jgi:hypothetical protein
MRPIEKTKVFAFASAAAMSDNLTKSNVFSRNNNRTRDSHAHLSFAKFSL